MNLDYIRQDYHSVKPVAKNTLKVLPPTKSVASCKSLDILCQFIVIIGD